MPRYLKLFILGSAPITAIFVTAGVHARDEASKWSGITGKRYEDSENCRAAKMRPPDDAPNASMFLPDARQVASHGLDEAHRWFGRFARRTGSSGTPIDGKERDRNAARRKLVRVRPSRRTDSGFLRSHVETERRLEVTGRTISENRQQAEPWLRNKK